MMAPTITSEMQVPIAPNMSRTRRPTLSIRNRAGKVLRQLTIPYTPVARSDVYLVSGCVVWNWILLPYCHQGQAVQRLSGRNISTLRY